MKLLFEENIIEYKQTPSSEEIIQTINEMMEGQYFFSHLIINGVEVYEEPESYMFDEDIQVIEVKARTVEQFLDEVLISAVDYCGRARIVLPELVRGFSRLPSDSHWEQFSQMLEGMEWLHHMIQHVDRVKGRQFNELIIIGAHLEVLTRKLYRAFESQDYFFISRYIQNELLPIYETLEGEIAKLLQ